ncbi:hypothetical protein BC937DRAFT_87132 [Endogone sp. FLAS-F59071]|nr:hypothetical protein BC937DRAFT_87132 [Endogone sp. FLAS-F59071]|eukprot:RUS12740.1 hypothetical protein BC937DRAFT_87132 [Endogone sp. FLAS-F59071]
MNTILIERGKHTETGGGTRDEKCLAPNIDIGAGENLLGGSANYVSIHHGLDNVRIKDQEVEHDLLFLFPRHFSNFRNPL